MDEHKVCGGHDVIITSNSLSIASDPRARERLLDLISLSDVKLTEFNSGPNIVKERSALL